MVEAKRALSSAVVTIYRDRKRQHARTSTIKIRTGCTNNDARLFVRNGSTRRVVFTARSRDFSRASRPFTSNTMKKKFLDKTFFSCLTNEEC